MARLIKGRSETIGLVPGSLEFSGDKKVDAIYKRIIDYDAENVDERPFESARDAFPYRDRDSVTWLNIDGLHDTELISELGNHFGIHALVLEDVVHTGQRPKAEDHGDHLYIVLRMLYYDRKKLHLLSEQLSLIVGNGYVISFQERLGDVFNPVRERIRGSFGRIRERGADYLAHALIDIIIDNYFLILEDVSEQVEDLEQKIIEDAHVDIMTEIGSLRRELILLRKAVWPVRDLLNSLLQSESKLIRTDTRLFLRDAYDHAVQIIEIVESLRDMISVLRDSYQSAIGNRMNEIMKVLTIIATIFIPLTFIAGIYGMNFQYMPELGARLGYPIALGAMAIIGIGLALYFKFRKWI